MRADQDSLQRAVVSFVAMMGALLNSTFDALICVTVHKFSSFTGDGFSMTIIEGKIHSF